MSFPALSSIVNVPTRRLSYVSEFSASIESEIPRETLRAYIAYAKEEMAPYIRDENTEAQEYLTEEFLKIRLANAETDDNPVPVTYRQEEAIERLAEASARIRLSDEVTKADVDRALTLVRKSMEQVSIDPETGESMRILLRRVTRRASATDGGRWPPSSTTRTERR